MDHTAVIVRAHGGEPLKRAATEIHERLVYISNPAWCTESGDVGFPQQDVFVYDEDVFFALCQQWERDGKTNPETWARLRRLTHQSAA